METRPFGPAREPWPVVGQGSWQMERDRAASVAALRRGLDLGMRVVDTAEMYGDGAVERIVGEAIAGRREEVLLVSKVLPQNASRRGTIDACERSLRRLGVERLDLYLLHWPGDHPLEETIAAFEDLVRAGKTRLWGVSNFDVDDLERAVAIAGPGRLACNQVLYHLGERAIEHAVIPWCEQHDVSVQAYSPFGSGSFPDPASRGGRVLAEVARVKDATSRQVALAVLARRASVFPIPKSSSTAHAEENARAQTVRLDAADLRRLESAFPLGPRPRSLPTI